MRAQWFDDQYEFRNRRYMGAVEGTLDFTWNPGCPGSRDTPAEGGFPDELEPAISDMTLIDTDTGLEYVVVRDYQVVIIEINGVNTMDLMVEIVRDMRDDWPEIARDHMMDRMYEVSHE
jgi:hypothetical protein